VSQWANTEGKQKEANQLRDGVFGDMTNILSHDKGDLDAPEKTKVICFWYKPAWDVRDTCTRPHSIMGANGEVYYDEDGTPKFRRKDKTKLFQLYNDHKTTYPQINEPDKARWSLFVWDYMEDKEKNRKATARKFTITLPDGLSQNRWIFYSLRWSKNEVGMTVNDKHVEVMIEKTHLLAGMAPHYHDNDSRRNNVRLEFLADVCKLNPSRYDPMQLENLQYLYAGKDDTKDDYLRFSIASILQPSLRWGKTCQTIKGNSVHYATLYCSEVQDTVWGSHTLWTDYFTLVKNDTAKKIVTSPVVGGLMGPWSEDEKKYAQRQEGILQTGKFEIWSEEKQKWIKASADDLHGKKNKWDMHREIEWQNGTAWYKDKEGFRAYKDRKDRLRKEMSAEEKEKLVKQLLENESKIQNADKKDLQKYEITVHPFDFHELGYGRTIGSSTIDYSFLGWEDCKSRHELLQQLFLSMKNMPVPGKKPGTNLMGKSYGNPEEAYRKVLTWLVRYGRLSYASDFNLVQLKHKIWKEPMDITPRARYMYLGGPLKLLHKEKPNQDPTVYSLSAPSNGTYADFMVFNNLPDMQQAENLADAIFQQGRYEANDPRFSGTLELKTPPGARAVHLGGLRWTEYRAQDCLLNRPTPLESQATIAVELCNMRESRIYPPEQGDISTKAEGNRVDSVLPLENPCRLRYHIQFRIGSQNGDKRVMAAPMLDDITITYSTGVRCLEFYTGEQKGTISACDTKGGWNDITKGTEFKPKTIQEKKVEKDPVVQIKIIPDTAECRPGKQVKFRAWGITQSGKDVALRIRWDANTGDITEDGTYTAPAHFMPRDPKSPKPDSLDDIVKATDTATGKLEARARVVITRR
jgi:hypothetical protein